jgi:hypothetical protein
MIRHTENPVYNSPVHYMSKLASVGSHSARLALVLIGIAVSCCAASWAADWTTPEHQLAQKIVAASGPGAIYLEVTNRSSLGPKQAEEITRGLNSQLAALGARFVAPEPAAVTVKVSLSENLQAYVWVAEITQGSESSVALVSAPRLDTLGIVRDATSITVRKAPLWSEDKPILDLVTIEGNPVHFVVLTPEQLEIYRFENGHYQQDQALPITHARPWPRDLRGRLMLSKEHAFDVYLPGVFCQASGATSVGLSCRPSDDPWPLSTRDSGQSAFFSPTRNFFTGGLTPGLGKQKAAPPFYSAAPLPHDKYTLWVFTGLDGQVHMLDGITDQSSRFDWGSDIASVKTNCGAGWQVLAVRSSNGSGDTVRAYELPDRDPVPVSPSLELDGTVTAMWTESTGTTALAVTQNLNTGTYDAFRLSIACGQ